uniref:Uncharacterized protein n=1 Tax=Lepeophtheirus salmonis TaxID=72036 RepID=A0A0K2TFF7_LEPSM
MNSCFLLNLQVKKLIHNIMSCGETINIGITRNHRIRCFFSNWHCKNKLQYIF